MLKKGLVKQCVYFIISVFIIGFLSCKEEKAKDGHADELTANNSSSLELDHLNIWVTDPQLAKEKLASIGFTGVPDSLSQVHHGQGTSGRYFNFLNTYLELIFVYDSLVLLENNRKNENLDFTLRANNKKNGASPFSIALKMNEYNADKIPFEKVLYHQSWMEEKANIYSAKNSKINLGEPSVFVVYPEIEAANFASIAELERFPSDDDSWKSFFKHPNGAQNITQVVIKSANVDLTTETMKAINALENVEVKDGEEHLMELFFDGNAQGKTFDLRPELPLIIHI
ncbi:MAG: VOC family protein [Bacteroidia bacterium]